MSKIKSNYKKTDYLIIGNSAAGLSAAENIRKIDKTSRIDIYTWENHKNYSKPLITYYLAGKLSLDKVYFRDENFYTGNNISLKSGSEITDIDPEKQQVLTARGDTVSYYKLLVAGGGKPIVPPIKVMNEKGEIFELNKVITELKGVFTLTTLDGAIALKRYIEDNRISSASILGGGLIGLKAAEAFLDLGIRINVIELSDRILSASFDKTASEIISDKISEAGSNILTGSTIEEVYVTKGRITAYRLKNGQKIPCSLLVVAIGVLPNVEMIKNSSGVSIDNGIIVDASMKTTSDNIYAAGDIIKSFDQLTGQKKNIAIWPLAVKQGSIAGRNMAGENIIYQGCFFMNSVEILGIPVISLGLSSLDDSQIENIKIYKIYSPEKKIYRKIIVRDKKVIGAILIGAIERAGIYAGLINNKIDISEIKDNIAKEDFGIIQLPADYRKHLVIGEGIEV